MVRKNDVNVCLVYSESDCDLLTEAGASSSTSKGRTRKKESSRALVSSNKKTAEDVFAQIIFCSESSNKNMGMPKYMHLHHKISQTVCNAIFLCKVIQEVCNLHAN